MTESALPVPLIDLSGESARNVSYAELEERLDRFAALVTKLGLKPGDRLAMSIGNRFDKLSMRIVHHGLQQLLFLFFHRPKRRSDILIAPALDHKILNPDFFHQVLKVGQLHDDADTSG